MPFLIKNYSSIKKIAEGGMSQLFLATEVSTSRVVVIKKMVLPQENRLLSLRRFENEVCNTLSLTHNNIISIIDYGNDTGNFYIVMEHIDGCDFNKFISDISFDRTIGLLIVFKAIQALRFAHTKGIIHCDIKPANLLIGKNGRVVLSDFGLSLKLDQNQDCSNFTTPLFMPPEQAYLVSEHAGLEKEKWVDTVSIVYNDLTPEQVSAITERGIHWDIWSAGVLLYRVCTGYYPFQESDFAGLLKSIMFSDPIINLENVPDLPYSVASVIQKCLQKDPYKRSKSLDQVVNVLQKYFTFLGISNVDETITAYMRENSDLYTITETSVVSNDKNSSNASDISLMTQSDSEWQYNDFNESMAQKDSSKTQDQSLTAQSDWLTKQSEPSSKQSKPQIKQYEKSTSPSESEFKLDLEWEPDANKSPLFIASKKFKGLFSLWSRIQKRGLSGARKILHFSNIRLRLGHMIATMTIIILAVTGLLVFNQHTGKQEIFKGVPRDVENSSNNHLKPEIKTPEQAMISIKDSINTLPKQENVKSIPDSGTENKLISAQVESSKPSQTPKIVRSANPAIKNAYATNHTIMPGILKLSIDPTEAQVYVEGSLLSLEDVTNGKSFTPGKYIISVNAAGYIRYSQYITIESNKTLLLNIDLKPDVKGNGQLHIYSYPWANLYIDDELIGTTPTPSPVLLVEGNHNVVLKRDGYQPYNEIVTIQNGETVRLKVQLKKTGE